MAGILESKKGLHLCHLNVRSLWSKIELLKHQIPKSNIPIFAISETWLTPSTTNNLINLPNYNFLRLDREIKKAGGGIGVYIRSDIIYTETDLKQYSISNADIECLWFMTIQPNNKRYITAYL